MKRLMAVCMCIWLAPAAAWAQSDQHQHGGMAPKDIGTVSFETSCSPATKTKFNEAVALLHSFWFAESRAIFESVLKDDPNCAMAYWGIALTHWGNPFAGQRSAQTIANGKAAIDKGLATGSPTPREKGYIDAVAILFSSNDVTTQRQRVLDYEKAMGRVSVANKADIEARIFWALSVAQAASPTDKTYARNLQAAEMLEPLTKQMPKHPGIAHYIIHAYDVPLLAPKALPAARSYAGIAPVVPHALHMPSHTFTRVGYWKESVDSNVKSAEIAEKTNGIGEAMHARDYMTYAYLQMGMDSQAKDEHRPRDAPRRDGRRHAGRGGRRTEHVRPGRDSGALCDGAPAVGRGRGARAAPGAEHAVHRSDHALRARRRRRPRGPAGRCRRRRREARRACAIARSR